LTEIACKSEKISQNGMRKIWVCKIKKN